MTLPAGTRLGPYEVQELLGSGGMGEVYRARDDRLERDVALKVLHDGRPGGPDHRARLVHEARAASALNHPSIVTVFDIGTDSGVSYVVSELIAGEPLRGDLARGPLEMGRLLSLATQIAAGIAAAHAAGITHGDLKPENVLVARDGSVKIVDFGLATVIGPLTKCGDASPSSVDTLPGLILGTVAYASPECAQGALVDARSDQFSFGVMLFEMAAGVQPFRRASPVETLEAILHDDAPDVVSLNPKVPPALQWILDRCLAKTPADRYASTMDLVLDLRAVRDRVPRKLADADVSRPRARRYLRFVIAAGAVTGVVTLAAWRILVPQPAAAVSGQVYTPLATDPGFQGQPAWSPEGTTVAYVAEVEGVLQVFTRSVTAPTRSQVTFGQFDCVDPFWSADGRYIYYHSPRGAKVGLYRTAPINGTPETVLENATTAAFSPDGRMLAFLKDESDQGGTLTLWLASPPDAAPQKYDEAPLGRIGFSSAIPRFSPDGTKLLLWFQRWFADRDVVPLSGFFTISLADRHARQVLESLAGNLTPENFSWLPDSRHIVVMVGSNRDPAVHLWMGDTVSDRAWPVTTSTESEGSQPFHETAASHTPKRRPTSILPESRSTGRCSNRSSARHATSWTLRGRRRMPSMPMSPIDLVRSRSGGARSTASGILRS